MFKITDKSLKLYCCTIIVTFWGSIAVALFAESLYVKATSVLITTWTAFGIITVVMLLLAGAINLQDPQTEELHERFDQQL
ncbi:hypothetical protein [Vibrio sp. 10N.239.312.D08]|uniref:hypothetical protein n=1 Tax=Vibrio sp. 10N.239.312.D08 TaxID=3229978 RepID=UPI00354B1641